MSVREGVRIKSDDIPVHLALPELDGPLCEEGSWAPREHRGTSQQGAILSASILVGSGYPLLDKAWQEAREQWLAMIQEHSQNTARTYRAALDQYFEWLPVSPWQVSAGIARDWLNWLATQGKIVGRDARTGEVQRGPLADSSCALKLAAVSSFYRYVQLEYSMSVPEHPEGRRAFQVLCRHKEIVIEQDRVSLWPAHRANPFEGVERPDVPSCRSAQFPTTHELKALLASIDTATLSGKRDLALFLTMAWTCRRASEMLQLKWGDLYPTTGDKYIYRYDSRRLGKPVWVDLDSRVYEAIADYLAASDRLKTIQPDDYLFVPLYPERAAHFHSGASAGANRPLSLRTAADLLKKYARKIGMEPERSSLRGLIHAGALLRYERMKEEGRVDYAELQKVLDHKNRAVTVKYVQEVLEGSTAAEDALAAWDGPVRRRRRA